MNEWRIVATMAKLPPGRLQQQLGAELLKRNGAKSAKEADEG